MSIVGVAVCSVWTHRLWFVSATFAHVLARAFLLQFLAATIEAQGYIAEDRIAEAFDRIDSDDSGYITTENLREFLGNDCTPEQMEDIIRSADTSKDGKM
jgi:Ca2+-binding EF-hand superfamily protein